MAFLPDATTTSRPRAATLERAAERTAAVCRSHTCPAGALVSAADMQAQWQTDQWKEARSALALFATCAVATLRERRCRWQHRTAARAHACGPIPDHMRLPMRGEHKHTRPHLAGARTSSSTTRRQCTPCRAEEAAGAVAPPVALPAPAAAHRDTIDGALPSPVPLPPAAAPSTSSSSPSLAANSAANVP